MARNSAAETEARSLRLPAFARVDGASAARGVFSTRPILLALPLATDGDASLRRQHSLISEWNLPTPDERQLLKVRQPVPGGGDLQPMGADAFDSDSVGR